MEKLHCHVQTYSWGKKGFKSEVARVYQASHNVEIGHDTPYAELWMGTHPDGPARLKTSQKKLSVHIAERDESVYDQINNDKHLPFIMKLMSIDHTLSLQVHPNKEQAAQLNERDPVHYPDRNHKPELAYALTRFELLCGFRPATEISRNILFFDELKHLMGKDTTSAFQILVRAGVSQTCETLKAALAVCFKNMVTKRPENIANLIESMLAKFRRGVRGSLTEGTVRVIQKMCVDFPNDIGCFAPLLLNHIVLMPGECCYYAPQELHAYLSGECVECVGCSNNTIRAACTPKFVDVEALCNVVSYRMTDSSYYILAPNKLKHFEHVAEYAPDCKDFVLHKIQIPDMRADSLPLAIPSLKCDSIMVIVDGNGVLENYSDNQSQYKQEKERMGVQRGDIIYLESHAQPCFVKCTQPIKAYRTFSYESGPNHSERRLPNKVVVQKHGRAKFLVMDQDTEVMDVEVDMDGIC